MTHRASFVIAALLTLAACAAEPESVANRFARTTAEIENKARAYEAKAENEANMIVAPIDNEADAFLNGNNLSNASAPAEANAALVNGAR